MSIEKIILEYFSKMASVLGIQIVKITFYFLLEGNLLVGP